MSAQSLLAAGVPHTAGRRPWRLSTKRSAWSATRPMLVFFSAPTTTAPAIYE